MTKFYETRGFLKLKKHWYKLLERDGLKDIENKDYEYDLLPSGIKLKNPNFSTLEQTMEYYSIANDHLINGCFENDIAREIWGLHSQGDTFAEIGEKIKRSKSNVAHHVWKIQRQLNLKKSRY